MMLRYARFLLRERDVQRAVVELCRLYGGVVYSLSQGYRPGPRRHATTRQTKGLPDLWVFFPARKVGMWIEVKRPGGVRTPEQDAFADLCERTGVPYVCGGVDEVSQALRKYGVASTTPTVSQ